MKEPLFDLVGVSLLKNDPERRAEEGERIVEHLRKCRKRVWGPYGTDGFGEIPEGAVPMWAIDEVAAAIRTPGGGR